MQTDADCQSSRDLTHATHLMPPRWGNGNEHQRGGATTRPRFIPCARAMPCATYADLVNDDVQSTVNYAVSMSKATYAMKFYYGHAQYHLGEISAIDGQIAGERYFTW